MKGTVIKNLKLVKVIDGDTIKVLLDNEQESIRFVCLDTEESQHGGDKPVTNAGLLASKWAKQYFGAEGVTIKLNHKYINSFNQQTVLYLVHYVSKLIENRVILSPLF
jgi:hypothetical protein